MEKRPTEDEYFLNVAKEIASRSTCLRSKYGSVIVKNSIIKATGYNGSASGTPNCCDLGYCSRDESGTQRYDNCRALHGEANALQFCNREDAIESVLYVARHPSSNPSVTEVSPCPDCRRRILNAKVKRVVCLQDNGTIIEFDPRDWIAEL